MFFSQPPTWSVYLTRRTCVVVCYSLQSVENLPSVFGSNSKAQTAARAVFDLAHRHGNILREGWKNIMDSMLQLFRSELLPKAMVEVSAPGPCPCCQCFQDWWDGHSTAAPCCSLTALPLLLRWRTF